MSVEDRSNRFFVTLERYGKSPCFSRLGVMTPIDVDKNVLTSDDVNI